VVCSRTPEYQALRTGLRVDAAVELCPPSNAAVDVFLASLEATGTPLNDVRAAAAEDQALQDLLHSPLMLYVIALAYRGRLVAPGDLQARQARLWDAYMMRMFEQRPLLPDSGYTVRRRVGGVEPPGPGVAVAVPVADRLHPPVGVQRPRPTGVPTQRGWLMPPSAATMSSSVSYTAPAHSGGPSRI
jgi:hypothetical protein